MSIRTRFAEERDLPQVADLFDQYRRFYEQPADADLALRFLTARMTGKESVILVAEADDAALAGFCQMYPTFCSVAAAPTLVLYDLFVAPAYRRAGVGRLLMQAAEACGAKAGVARMDLQTARSNLPAQSLYESLGWKRDEHFYTYSKRPA